MLKRWIQKSYHCAFLDLAPQTNVMVAGVGRSGTTWVQNLINHRRDHRVMFEPFRNQGVANTRIRAVPFRRQSSIDSRYIPRGDGSSAQLAEATCVLSGRWRSFWADRFNKPTVYRKRLLKTIRCNLCLPWLAEHFPTLKIILLIRHPLAVTVSRMRMGWFRNQSGTFFTQDELVRDHLSDVLHYHRRDLDPFLETLLCWCVLTVVPLRQLGSFPCHVLYYEDLVLDPEQHLPLLLDFVGDSPHSDILHEWRRPSELSFRADRATLTPAQRVWEWRENLTSEQIAQAGEMLQQFGLDRVYDADGLPSRVESLTSANP